MNDMRFWEMTLSGASIIMVIVLIRALAINRLPKRIFLFLWGAVGIFNKMQWIFPG